MDKLTVLMPKGTQLCAWPTAAQLRRENPSLGWVSDALPASFLPCPLAPLLLDDVAAQYTVDPLLVKALKKVRYVHASLSVFFASDQFYTQCYQRIATQRYVITGDLLHPADFTAPARLKAMDYYTQTPDGSPLIVQKWQASADMQLDLYAQHAAGCTQIIIDGNSLAVVQTMPQPTPKTVTGMLLADTVLPPSAFTSSAMRCTLQGSQPALMAGSVITRNKAYQSDFPFFTLT